VPTPEPRPEPERKEPSQLIGDGLREMAVLFLVFYILDFTLRGSESEWGLLFIAIMSVALFWYGIILEGSDE
jgi:hypothetical protein